MDASTRTASAKLLTFYKATALRKQTTLLSKKPDLKQKIA